MKTIRLYFRDIFSLENIPIILRARGTVSKPLTTSTELKKTARYRPNIECLPPIYQREKKKCGKIVIRVIFSRVDVGTLSGVGVVSAAFYRSLLSGLRPVSYFISKASATEDLTCSLCILYVFQLCMIMCAPCMCRSKSFGNSAVQCRINTARKIQCIIIREGAYDVVPDSFTQYRRKHLPETIQNKSLIYLKIQSKH